jgi:hypothetical protein
MTVIVIWMEEQHVILGIQNLMMVNLFLELTWCLVIFSKQEQFEFLAGIVVAAFL